MKILPILLLFSVCLVTLHCSEAYQDSGIRARFKAPGAMNALKVVTLGNENEQDIVKQYEASTEHSKKTIVMATGVSRKLRCFVANYINFKQKIFLNRLGTIYFPNVIASEKTMYIYHDAEKPVAPKQAFAQWSAGSVYFSMHFQTFTRYFSILEAGNTIFWAHLTRKGFEKETDKGWLNSPETKFGFAVKKGKDHIYHRGCLDTSSTL